MSNSDENSININRIIVIVCVVALIVVGFYSSNFTSLLSNNIKEFLNVKLELSIDNGDWGTFGDYIGGILNPIVSAFALYLAAKAYESQKGESKKQIEIAALTALLNTDHSLFDYLTNEIQITKKQAKIYIPVSL